MAANSTRTSRHNIIIHFEAGFFISLAPIGGCFHKKPLDIFSPVASVSLKHNLNGMAIGYFV
jgi:hypothetical protein